MKTWLRKKLHMETCITNRISTVRVPGLFHSLSFSANLRSSRKAIHLPHRITTFRELFLPTSALIEEHRLPMKKQSTQMAGKYNVVKNIYLVPGSCVMCRPQAMIILPGL